MYREGWLMSISEGEESTEALRGVDVEMFLKRGILDINREEEFDDEEDAEEEEDADASLASESTLVSDPVLGNAFISPKYSSASFTAVP